MFKKIRQLLCRHHFPDPPKLIFKNDFCLKYEIKCVKCEYVEIGRFPNQEIRIHESFGYKNQIEFMEDKK